MSDRYPRMLSDPADIEWMGWRSDTVTLQRTGWKLAASHNPMRDRIQLLMQHEQMDLYAYTDEVEMHRRTLHDEYLERPRPRPLFHVQHMARSLMVARNVHIDVRAMRHIDAEPQYTEERPSPIHLFNIFAQVARPEQQVMIDRADMSVIEHLEAIKELQSAKQREIRDRLLNERARERPTQQTPKLQIVAQLVHYEAA